MVNKEPTHCMDCCCARSWKALGVSQHTGRSIVEHIEELRAALTDIVLGADMMLGSRPMASLHSYAAEVKRVAKAALSADTARTTP